MKKLIGLALLITSTSLIAAPFGISKNTLLSAVDAQAQISTKPVKLTSVPENEGFSTFYAKVSPAGVICAVTAIATPFKTTPEGLETRQATDALALSVKKDYGAYKQIDYVQPGSIISSLDRWTQAVRQGQRTYGYLWKKEYDSALPSDLFAVSVMAHVVTDTKATVIKEVEYINPQDCK